MWHMGQGMNTSSHMISCAIDVIETNETWYELLLHKV